MEKFEHLEKSFNERSEKATSSLERDWRARIEKDRFGYEESTAALTRDFEMELATVRQQMERSRGIEESYQAAARDLTTMKGSVEELTQSLADAHNEIADRDRRSRIRRGGYRRAPRPSRLKAVIDDFSRSVEGYMRTARSRIKPSRRSGGDRRLLPRDRRRTRSGRTDEKSTSRPVADEALSFRISSTSELACTDWR
jgi:hypothetical protein